MKNIYKTIVILFCVVFSVVNVGCSKTENKMTEDGKILSLIDPDAKVQDPLAFAKLLSKRLVIELQKSPDWKQGNDCINKEIAKNDYTPIMQASIEKTLSEEERRILNLFAETEFGEKDVIGYFEDNKDNLTELEKSQFESFKSIVQGDFKKKDNLTLEEKNELEELRNVYLLAYFSMTKVFLNQSIAENFNKEYLKNRRKASFKCAK